MGFIKIGYNSKREVICTLCKGIPNNPEFFYIDEKGMYKEAKNPIVIEFNPKNLKKMIKIFKNDNQTQ